MTRDDLVIGIDLGTSGVRTLAATAGGDVLVHAAAGLARGRQAERTHEQSPAAWWRAVCETTQEVMRVLHEQGRASAVRALAVDGTSGTVLPVDADGTPLRDALMYHDGRATDEAQALNEAAAAWCARLGYRFSASFGLAKILWLRHNEPDVFARTHRIVHQADFVAARLTGRFGVTDYSNALKTGYDLLADTWPAWLERWGGVTERLPAVVAPGALLGPVTHRAAGATGVPAGVAVLAGATDGTAGFLASGARTPGDYNTTLGTTLIFKGVSTSLHTDPQGRAYSHRLPNSTWLPGAASNTGAEWIPALYPGADPAVLDRAAEGLLPSEHLAYPLMRRGERFPFMHREAEQILPSGVAANDLYAACLQGTAFVERLGYEVLDGITGQSGGAVYSTGGGSRSDVWMHLRADACGRVLHRPAYPDAALGSAILAAAGTCYDGLDAAVAGMTRVTRSFDPRPDRRARYDDLYARWLDRLRRRGWLP